LKIYTFRQSQEIPITLEKAWEFFSNPENLNSITPPDLEFRITSGTPAPMHEGQIITYKIRIAPMIWQTWVTEIKAVTFQSKFIDEQRSGPYKFWHHCHRFEPTENGTLVTDEVNYALPFYLLGNVAHGLFVKKKLNKIFQYRKEILSKKFG
jgi:ligand-binding SRPBCC domain-containing protein|tara:strand:+ start:798 stop:1253 length:456 start_codon:yes stop_codon:yes gene_type:complete